MATKTQVKDETLIQLGVIELGAAAADDSDNDSRMDAAYDEVFDWLKDKGLDTWSTSGTIPSKIKPHLVALMAENALDTYHVPAEKFQRITLVANKARRDLPGLSMPDYESLDNPKDY